MNGVKMTFLNELGLENIRIVGYKDEQLKEGLAIISDNKNTEIELILLNQYFLSFLKKNEKEVSLKVREIIDNNGIGLDDENFEEMKYVYFVILNDFLKYFKENHLKEPFQKKLKQASLIPSFEIVYQKIAYGIQLHEKHKEEHIAVLFASRNSQIDKNKSHLIKQVRTCIIKSEIFDIQPTIHINKIDNSTLDILNMATEGKKIIENGDAILYIQTVSNEPKLKGAFELKSLY